MEAFQQQFHPNKNEILTRVQRLLSFIRVNCLIDIQRSLSSLPADQCTMVLNSSIRGSTPLFVAASFGRFRISRYLIKLSLRNGRREMCDSWKRRRHPLTGAMVSGYVRIVELLLRNMSDINEPFHGPFTPLMFAVFMNNMDYVHLLIRLGADTNIACFNGSAPISASFVNEHLCRILIANNVDLNCQDEYGISALHSAVATNNVTCVEVLINAGANISVRTKQGMTPLMWGAVHSAFNAVNFLIQYTPYSVIEKIEAWELLSANFICIEQPNIEYSIQSLQMRGDRFPKKTLCPLQELLDFSVEFTTAFELEKLKESPLQLAFQGILIVERILGRNSGMYLRLLLNTSLIAKKTNHMTTLRQLIDFIPYYFQPDVIEFVNLCWGPFLTLFEELAKDNDPEIFFENGAFALFKLIAQATIRMWQVHKKCLSESPNVKNMHYINIVDKFLYVTSQIKKLNPARKYLQQFYKVIVQVVKADPRVIVNHSLLHRAIKSSRSEKHDSVELARILLECGADVNAKDHFRRTPLMYAIKHASENDLRGFVSLLLEYNCHLDCRTDEGFSALDHVRLLSLSIIPRSPLPLKCKTAAVILENQIPYEGVRIKSLCEFVDLHK